MTPRKLLLTEQALDDIQRRALYLTAERGVQFALLWSDTLIDWLEHIASIGAQLGTEHPVEKSIRTFGYKRQATVLADFQVDEQRVVRIYFAGQDWTN